MELRYSAELNSHTHLFRLREEFSGGMVGGQVGSSYTENTEEEAQRPQSYSFLRRRWRYSRRRPKRTQERKRTMESRMRMKRLRSNMWTKAALAMPAIQQN